MIDLNALKKGDRLELEIEGKKGPLYRTAVYLGAEHDFGVCLDTPIHGDDCLYRSLGFTTAEQDVLIRSLGMADASPSQRWWRLDPSGERGKHTKILSVNKPDLKPTLANALANANTVKMSEVKVGDRVRVAHNTSGSPRSKSASEAYEALVFCDATVIGECDGHKFIGWKTDEGVGATLDCCQTPDNPIANINEFVKAHYFGNELECLLLSSEDRKPEVKADPIANLKTALKMVEEAVNQIVATDTSISSEDKAKLSAELGKLMKIDITAPKEAEKPMKQATLKDAKVGDVVEIFLSPYNYIASSPTKTKLQTTIIGKQGGSYLLGWKDKPSITTLQDGTPDPGFESYKYSTLCADYAECNILPIQPAQPELPKEKKVMKLEETKVGDKVKLYYTTNGTLSSKPTARSFEATVLGFKNSQALLAFDNASFASWSGYESLNTIWAKGLSFDRQTAKYGRWSSKTVKCEVLSSAAIKETPPKSEEAVQDLSTVKLGQKVKIFLDKFGNPASVETDWTIETTVVGFTQANNPVLGWKKDELKPKYTYQPHDDVYHFASKVANISDYTVYSVYKNTKCIVPAPPTETKRSATLQDANLGDIVELFVNKPGEVVQITRTAHPIRGKVIGKTRRGFAIVATNEAGLSVHLTSRSDFPQDVVGKTNDYDSFAFAQAFNPVCACNIIELKLEVKPEVKNETKRPATLGKAKLGDTVEVFLSEPGGCVQISRTEYPIRVKVIGYNDLGFVVGTNDKCFSKYLMNKHSVITKSDDFDSFAFNCGFIDSIECDIIEAAAPAVKEVVGSSPDETKQFMKLGDCELGEKVLVHLEAESSIEGTVVGFLDSGPVLGWKTDDPNAYLHSYETSRSWLSCVPDIDQYRTFSVRPSNLCSPLPKPNEAPQAEVSNAEVKIESEESEQMEVKTETKSDLTVAVMGIGAMIGAALSALMVPYKTPNVRVEDVASIEEATETDTQEMEV